jgi:ABC-type lipoprotein export system ATPase subunit
MITFTNVSKIYKSTNIKVPIFENLNLQVETGDFLVVRGPSGSGKTTLLRLIGGLSSPDFGEIRVSRNNLGKMTHEQLALFRAAYIGFVFQDFHLINTLTCLENVMLPLELSGAFLHEAREAALVQLQKVGLEQRLNHFPFQLSGGEQQRAALARALVNNPSLLLADEPTANLDNKTRHFIILALKEVHLTYGITIVVATHDPGITELATCLLELQTADNSYHFSRLAPPLKKDQENIDTIFLNYEEDEIDISNQLQDEEKKSL